jgi:hypothetical protein
MSRVDALISALRAFPVEIDGDVDVLLEALTDEAERFLRAGGTVSLVEWAALEEKSRDALAEAGDRIRFATAALIGAASISGDYASAIAEGGDTDPDEIRVRVALDQSLRRLGAKIDGRGS